MKQIEIGSIPTKNYKEAIEVRVPVRFYWNRNGRFDGIELELGADPLPWQEDMAKRCVEAVMTAILGGPKIIDERKGIGIFLKESKETFHAVYRDAEGEQTYTIARHAIDKIIRTLKQGKPLK